LASQSPLSFIWLEGRVYDAVLAEGFFATVVVTTAVFKSRSTEAHTAAHFLAADLVLQVEIRLFGAILVSASAAAERFGPDELGGGRVIWDEVGSDEASSH